MNKVLEVVTCKLNAHIDHAAFMEAVSKSQRVLEGYNGYLSRTVLHDQEADRWIDLVYWASMDEAKKAADAFGDEADVQALIRAIDPTTMSMHHFTQIKELDISSPTNFPHVEPECVEVIIFKLKAGIQQEQYIQVARDMGDLLQASQGFINREIFYSDEMSSWIEINQLTNRASVDHLFEQLKDSPSMTEGMNLVDESSMSMYFARPKSLNKISQ
jgi:hypothetical protein